VIDKTAPPPPPWRPGEEDLADWAKILICDAYLQRPRIRASREDFTQAAIAMLLALGWRSAFRPEVDVAPALRRRWGELPGIVEAMVDAGPTGTPEWARYVERDNSGLATVIRAQTGVDPRDEP
jgi:hypothetical protein